MENRDLDDWFLNSLGNNQVDPIAALEDEIPQQFSID